MVVYIDVSQWTPMTSGLRKYGWSPALLTEIKSASKDHESFREWLGFPKRIQHSHRSFHFIPACLSGSAGIPIKRWTWLGEQAGSKDYNWPNMSCIKLQTQSADSHPGWPKSAELFWSFLEAKHHQYWKNLSWCFLSLFLGLSYCNQSGCHLQQHLRNGFQKLGAPQETGFLDDQRSLFESFFWVLSTPSILLRLLNGSQTAKSRTAWM